MDVIIKNKKPFWQWIILGGIFLGILMAITVPKKHPIQSDKISALEKVQTNIEFDISAEVIPANSVIVSISYPARLVKKHIENGQLVKKGDVLLVFASAELDASLKEKQSNLLLEKARFEGEKERFLQEVYEIEADIKLLQLDLDDMNLRFNAYSDLVREGSYSSLDYRSAQFEVKKAEMLLINRKEYLIFKQNSNAAIIKNKMTEFIILEQQIMTLIDRLNSLTVSAQYDGVITDLQVELGKVVTEGEGLFRLNGNSTYALEVSIPDHRFGEVYLNDEITFKIGSELMFARITRISRQVQGGYFKAKATLINQSQTFSPLGHTIRGMLISSTLKDAYQIKIPRFYTGTPTISLYAVTDKESSTAILHTFKVIKATHDSLFIERNDQQFIAIFHLNPTDTNHEKTIKWESIN